MDEIAQQAGSDSIVYELLGLFHDDVNLRLAELADAVKHQDRVRRERVAHSIKGSCANLGAERMAKLAAEIERCAEGCASEQIEVMLQEFQELCSMLSSRYPR